MSRLRARLSGDQTDQAIAEHVRRARLELESAIARARSSRGGPGTRNRRAQRVERDLAQALHALDGVSTISSPHDDEPSEEELTRRMRDRQARERASLKNQTTGVTDE